VTHFTSWPAGKGPLEIGKLAANEFKSHTGETYGGAGYSLALSWYGALRFTLVTGDKVSNAALITAFEPYAMGEKLVPNPDHSSTGAKVDQRVFGALPFEIYLENGDARCKKLGLDRADKQWSATNTEGITADARYWIDDMYMITGLQVMAYRALKGTGEAQQYLERAAKAMLVYIGKLQQTNQLQQPDGLFWHTQVSKAYWGRANGWVASGMTELLLELAAGETRNQVMMAFKTQMDALLPLQIEGGADAGCWRQVLNVPTAPAETSCTAMFTYALVSAVRNGWLTETRYADAARKGWLALGQKTDASGVLDNVCPGTGAPPDGSLASQQRFYQALSLGRGDLHAQAPLLWAATALVRPDSPDVR
jgi:unsaturated rhamnogalacturonyl hydrolase